MNLHSMIAASALVLAAAVPAQHAEAQAAEAQAGAPKIGAAYARATMPGQPNGGGYLTIDNGGRAADRLVGATAGVSKTVELHTMKLEGGVMRMRQLEAIELPAGGSVELKPGGTHLMFIGLNAPLKAGAQFPLTLRFEKAGDVTVDVKVEAPGGAAHDMMHKH